MKALKGSKRKDMLVKNLAFFAAMTLAFALIIDIRSEFVYAPGPLYLLADAAWFLYAILLMLFAFTYSNPKFDSVWRFGCLIEVILLVASILSITGFNNGVVLFVNIYPLLVGYAIGIPTLIIIFLGFYLLRKPVFKKDSIGFRYYKHIAIVLFISAIVLFFVYQVYIFGYSGIGSNDEMVISYYALHYALLGHNPYLYNSAMILKQNATRYGFTLLTNNTVVGRLDYPALYMLLGFPFYSLLHGNAKLILDNGNAIGYLIMLLLSFFAIAAVAGRRSLSDFKLVLIVILIFILYSLQVISFQYSFMIIILLFILRYIESPYVFILIGIAVSLQELLWVPALLAIVYIASAKGIKAGAKCIALSLIIFLLINGYFIAIGPNVFITQVFRPLNGNLVPSYLGPISSVIQAFANMPLGAYNIIFYLLLSISVLITAYSANKLTILTGMFISYLAISHSLTVYYIIPVVVLTAFFIMDQNTASKSLLERFFARNRITARRFTLTIIFSFAIFIVAIVIYYHGVYANNFGIRALSQSVVRNGNMTFDKVGIYNQLYKNQSVYVIEYYYLNNSGSNEIGINITNTTQNSRITNSSCFGNCKISGYMNNNYITLHHGMNYVYFYVKRNSTAIECSFYDNEYFYLCPSIYT